MNIVYYPLWLLGCKKESEESISSQDLDDDRRPALYPRFESTEFTFSIMPEGTFDYFYDFWNLLDVTSLTLIFLAYIFRLTVFFKWHNEREWDDYYTRLSVVLTSFALPITYMNLLYFIQGMGEGGKVVRMIIGIMKGVTLFLIILTVILFGFAAGFYTLFIGQEDLTTDEDLNPNPTNIMGQRSNYPLNIVNSYTMMLGEFEKYNDFVVSLEKDKEKVYAAIALFLVFTIFINISCSTCSSRSWETSSKRLKRIRWPNSCLQKQASYSSLRQILERRIGCGVKRRCAEKIGSGSRNGCKSSYRRKTENLTIWT